VNGDGFDDLIIGAYGADPNVSYSGASYVVFGGAANLAALDVADGVADGVISLANVGGAATPDWNFSYTQPQDMMLFSHMSLDAYNGTDVDATANVLRPPEGWKVILATWDHVGARPTTDKGELVKTYSTAKEAVGMQAVAYEELATGRVVISYRGTDSKGELASTSIPLGLGLPTNALFLQTSINFYSAVVHGINDQGGAAAIDPDLIAFTGHSLGGMLAGFMAGMTGAKGMVFDSGPHNQMVKYLEPFMVWPDGLNHLTTGPDWSGLSYAKVDGEVLSYAVEAAEL
jgi:hypothetical protein